MVQLEGETWQLNNPIPEFDFAYLSEFYDFLIKEVFCDLSPKATTLLKGPTGVDGETCTQLTAVSTLLCHDTTVKTDGGPDVFPLLPQCYQSHIMT